MSEAQKTEEQIAAEKAEAEKAAAQLTTDGAPEPENRPDGVVLDRTGAAR